MNRYSLSLLFLLLAASALAQFSATITVTDLGTGAPLQNASVNLNGNSQSTDAAGQTVFTGLVDGTYSYSVSAWCYLSGSGSFTINGTDATTSFALEQQTTNDVFFAIGLPGGFIGASVQLTDGAEYNYVFGIWDPWFAETVSNVPFGEYTYTITKPCYPTVTGTVTVDCSIGGILVSEDHPSELTTNNVFFFVGSPLQIMGATVTLTDGADYNTSFVTSDPFGDVVADVPYGEYSYTISAPCYETVSGTVAVECSLGEGNTVVADPVEITTNNLFFYIGSPFAIIGATVEITDGADYSHSFVTWDTWGGEMVENVPFGEYSYTITTPCYETYTATITVDCNNGEGIAVVAEPVEIVIDATVTLDGSVLTAAAAGLEYQWVDCDNGNAPIDGAIGQSFEPTQNGNYAVTITSGNCSQTSSCTDVTVTSAEDIEGRGAFVVYPNPFTEMVTVRTNVEAGTVRAELFNAAGQMVLDATHTGLAFFTVTTAHLPAGSYTLRLTKDDVCSTTRLVK